MVASDANAMTNAPMAKKMSAAFKENLRPHLSLQKPPKADPTAAPATAALTIRPCIQCNLSQNVLDSQLTFSTQIKLCVDAISGS